MKIPLAGFLALLIFGSAGSAASDRDAALREGNELYQTGKYVEALARYAEAGADEPRSGVPAYNLGNCLFRMDRYSEALQAYLVAEVHRPRDPRVANNIAVTAKRLKTDADVRGGFAGRVRTLLCLVSPEERLVVRFVLILLLVAAVVMWGIIPVLRGAPAGRKWMRFVLPVLILGAVIELGSGGGPRGCIGVVGRSAALVYNEPSEQADPLFSLHEGEIVTLKDRADGGDWLSVADREGHTGWVRHSAVLPVAHEALIHKHRTK